MELRFVECERAEKRRPHPPHPSLAGREPSRRRRARLAQSNNPRGVGDADKEYVRIEGATHYYQNQPDQLQRCIDAVLDWSRRKRLLAD
jgi:hypothetical protein